MACLGQASSQRPQKIQRSILISYTLAYFSSRYKCSSPFLRSSATIEIASAGQATAQSPQAVQRYYEENKQPPKTPICFGVCDDCGRLHARGLKNTARAFIQAGGILRCHSCARINKAKKKLAGERRRRAEWRESGDPRYAQLVARELNKDHRRRVRINATSDVTNAFLRRLRLSRKTCPLCGVRFEAANPATVDHVIPLAAGGTHTRDNLRVCCRSCNSRRGASFEDVSNFQLNLEMNVS